MKSRTSRAASALMAVLAGILMCPAACLADWIEVDGEGIFMGKIVSADGQGVKFKHESGKTSIYPKAKVLQMERDAASLEGHSDGERPDGGAGTGGQRRPGNVEMTGKPFLPEGHPLAPAEKAVFTAQRTLSNYLYYEPDLEKLAARIKGYADDLSNKKDIRKVFVPRNLPLGLAGVALLAAGAVASSIFAVRLMMAMFTVDFVWGSLFIGSGFTYYARKLGGIAGWVLTAFPPLLVLAFIVLYWEAARRPFTCLVLSVNALLAGMAMLVISL